MLTVPRYPSHSSSKGGILHNHSAIIIAKELTLCCVAHSLSCVQLFVTPWTAACQASLSFTTSQSLLKLISIKSVMPSNHFTLYHPSPSPLAFNLSQYQGRFFPMSQFFISVLILIHIL